MDKANRLRNLQFQIISSDKIATPIGAGAIPVGHSLSQWMAEKFNHNFDAYDSAIDSTYNSTHVGGSAYHHLLDGNHSIWGAFEAVKGVKSDDSFVTELSQASEHLLRDVTSVSGINPFFSMSQDHLDRLADLTQQIGVSKPFLVDALTINGPELLGGALALTAGLMMGNQPDPSRLTSFSGSCIVTALSSANPFLVPLAAGGLVYCLYKSENKIETFKQAGKGAIISGGALAASALIGGPIWLTCITAVGTAIAIRYLMDHPDKAFERMNKLIMPASSLYRKVSLKLM